jgi:putative peptidoglycan lipid II flippase
LAEGTLSSTLIPFLKDEIVNGNKLSFQKFRNDIFSLTIILLFFVSCIFFFFSESFIKIFASGFTDENIKLSSEMLQIMSPFLFFISLSAFNMGLLNSKSKFFAPAFSPTIFNLSVILSLILSFYFFDLNIIHLSYAVLLGAIGQFLFQLPYIYKNDLNYSLSLTNLINSKTKNFLLLLGPQVLGLGIYNINILINTQFASFMEDGSITYLYLSERLLEFPLGVFAVSIAVTSMTKFSEFSAKNETQQISE